MNREIKFRVWDKIDNCWSKDRNYIEDDGTVYGDCGRYEYELYQIKDAIVEQFISLKDKNNKEIYEGDIVTWEYKTTKGPYPMAVEYLDDRAAFGFCTNKTFMTFEDLMDFGNCLTVIGNIHENPELLK